MSQPDIRRILIVKLSALGDVVHALPVIDFLGRAAPGAQVDWAVDRRFAGLLEGNPGLRRVVSLDIKRWKRGWTTASARREASDAVRDLREGKYDVAFDLQGNAKSGVVVGLSGAPVRYGFDRNGVREAPNLLFTNRRVALQPGDRHISQKLLRIVSAPFGGKFELAGLRSRIHVTESQARRADRIVDGAFPDAHPLVVVHAGTTWGTKRMDPAFWAEALRILAARFPAMGAFLSWGSEEERREAGEIRESAGGRVELLPKMPLGELAAVYRRCGNLMAPDTGPLHVAAAAGAKTVSVFRVTDGNRNAPMGPGHRFLQAPMPCTACLRKRCARDAECRRSISPGAVADAMAGLMV
ncbi:MAG: lipopolysaccharide heptosyltransferase I [Deltaproteobacteria bacterium]